MGNVLGQITQAIAENDAMLSQKPVLGAMQQKNFIRPPQSMMGGVQPLPNRGAPPQGRMPPQQGMPPTAGQPPPPSAGGGWKSNVGAPAPRPVTAPYKSAEARNMLARQAPPMTGGINREGGNRGARNMAMRKEQEFQNANDLQSHEELKKVAGMVYKQSLNAGMDETEARDRADMIMRNPAMAKEVMADYMKQGNMKREQELETEETMRVEAKDAALLTDTQRDRLSSYKRFGIPHSDALAMSQNEDLSLDAGVKLWREQEALGKEQSAEQFNEQLIQSNAIWEAKNTVKQINNSLGYASEFGATGLLGSVLKGVPATAAYKTWGSVDTQKAKNAFLELMRMRQASTTGGALGNVSNREIELLYSAFTALDPAMGEEAFTSNLTDVLQRFERMQFMLEKEKDFELEGITAKEMSSRADAYVNRQVANSTDTPLEALEYLKENPDTVDVFKNKYGWSPISY